MFASSIEKLSAKDREKLVAALRKIWRYSKTGERPKVVARATVDKHHMKCDKCQQTFHKAFIDIDHITPIGGLVKGCALNVHEYLERLLFWPQQALCKNCHSEKTNPKGLDGL